MHHTDLDIELSDIMKTMGCIDPTGWQRHVNGMGLLVRLRGPEAHKTGLAHHLFCSFRAVSVYFSTFILVEFLAARELTQDS